MELPVVLQPYAPSTGKKFTVNVRVDITYDIPASILPPWATDLGVERMVEEAFNDWNKPLDLEALGIQGVLELYPSEISLGTITAG